MRSLDDLAAALLAQEPKDRRLIVGIDGAGGCGKSTLARALAPRLSGVVVEGDDFYRPSSERNAPSFDRNAVGASFDWSRLRDQVLAVAVDSLPIRYQRYDWDHDQLGSWVLVAEDQVLVVEGTYVTRPELRGFFDVTLWVEAPRDVRLQRGLERDGEDARPLWTGEWMPTEDRYVEAARPADHAQIVLDGSGTINHDPSGEAIVVFDRLH